MKTSWCSVVLFVVPTAARTLQPLALDALEKSVSVAAMLKFVARYERYAYGVKSSNTHFCAASNGNFNLQTITQKPGAPCLPCCCCGPAIECDGCSCVNIQAHCCCCVTSAAFPCNDEVPVALTVLGLTMYPKCGCMVPIKEVMDR